MKSIVLAMSLLFSLNASAAVSFCSELLKMQTALENTLGEIDDEIAQAATQADADVYIQRYEKTYRTYQDVRAQYADLCLN